MELWIFPVPPPGSENELTPNATETERWGQLQPLPRSHTSKQEMCLLPQDLMSPLKQSKINHLKSK